MKAQKVVFKTPTQTKGVYYDVSAIADGEMWSLVILRLVEFKMSEWDRPTELYPVVDSPKTI